MATRSDLYPSRWLASTDVETPIVATIDRCTIETVGQGARAERKPVVYFTSAIKPLICNATNYDAIVLICGHADTDDWRGTIVELYAIDVNGPNGPTRGVRVRAPRKVAKPTAKSARRPATRQTDDVDEAMPTLEEPAL